MPAADTYIAVGGTCNLCGGSLELAEGFDVEAGRGVLECKGTCRNSFDVVVDQEPRAYPEAPVAAELEKVPK